MNSSIDERAAVAARERNNEHLHVFPATYAQRSLWILNQLAPDSSFYNLHSGVRISSRLNEGALAWSLNEIIRRHESLRTTFKSEGEEPVQVVAANRSLEHPVIDLRQLSEAQREDEVDRIASEQALEPFDLSEWPLLRSCLLRLGEAEYIHLLTIHHIVCDNWSMNILLWELSTLYQARCAGRPSPLPAPQIQCADYAVWERKWLQGPKAAAHLTYWRNQLADVPALQLPTDWPRPAVSSFLGATFHFTLQESLYLALLTISKNEHCTLFMILLAAFQALLHRYSGQVDIVVGTPVANRNRLEVEELIGHFVNSLVLRSDLSGDPTFRELLARVRNTAVDAYSHQDLPFEKLVHELKPERGAGHNPFFQVHIQLLAAPGDDLDPDAPTDDLQGESLDSEAGTAKFDLALDLWEYPDGIEANFEYSTDLFREETIARMAGHFRALLEGIAADPDRRLSELPLLTRREHMQLVHNWNNTGTERPLSECLHQLFESQVDRTPEAVAVEFRGERFTYDVLNRRANQLARHLRTLGAGPETIIAIRVERSLAMIVGLLGILKAGAAYLPLDPAEPGERLRYMLQESRAALILTQQALVPYSEPPGLQQLILDENLENFAHYDDTNLSIDVSATNLAYVIYTSGSTGHPKGVMIESRSVCNHMRWMQATIPLTSTDRILLKYPFNFDASICEIFGSLVAGATLIIPEASEHWDISQFVVSLMEENVTAIDLVPSMLEALLDDGGISACRRLRRVTSGGEPLTAKLRDRFFEQMDAELHNIYGPTEGTIGVAHHICRRGEPAETVPIGTPGENMQVYLLDAHSNLVPVGVPGELCIGGVGVARGYLNQPQLTAERFIPDPFSAVPDACIYKTGDLARYLPDGSIDYLGRLDDQIKVRGYRLEPGEIEKAILQHGTVRNCVVLPIGGESGGHKRLAAWIVPERSEPAFWPSLGEYDVYDELLYYAMTHDKARVQAYKTAIYGSVKNKVVLDIGTGADAILTRLCIEGGARRVYAIESDATAYHSAKKLIENLELTDRVTVLHGDSSAVNLPEPVDVCVSELLGSIGSSEGVVSILNDARRFLKDDGTMIPRHCATLCAPVTLPPNLAASPRMRELPLRYVERVFQKAGCPFDLRVCVKDFPTCNVLARPGIFEDLDFRGVVAREHTVEIRFEVERDSRLDGFLFWLRLTPGDDETIDSLHDNVSWLPVFFPVFYPGQVVAQGDVIEVTCSSRLASDITLPDYSISGALLRKGRKPAMFEYKSPRRTTEFNGHPFYEALFSHLGDRGPLEQRSEYTERKREADEASHSLVPDLRKFLRERLPHYMVPSSFIVLDQLPTTRSGKIDRNALLARAQGRPDLKEAYVAPRTSTERALVEIWSELLGVEQVGVHDNFFELGGDSILTIQIVARANQAGLCFRPAQLFQHQTIAEIAALAILKPAVRSEQGVLGGDVPLTPIQHWYFEQNRADLHDAGQSLSMEVPRPVDSTKLAVVLNGLLMHHDALRLRFAATETGWRQTYATESKVRLERVDLSDLPQAVQDTALEKAANDILKGLNPSTGPIVRAALIDTGSRNTMTLLVAIHGLVMDEMSWSIFCEDLWSAYDQVMAGETIHLPPKTASYRLWSQQLTDQARSGAVESEIDYWRAMLQTAAGPMPRDFPDGEVAAPSVQVIVTGLDAHETQILLQDIPKTQRTQVRDLLLTAIAQAVTRWSGSESAFICLRGSARDATARELDSSRTIGSFTTRIPICLEMRGAGDPERALKRVKEHLRRMPSEGISFGLLRYLSLDSQLRAMMRAIPSPGLSFNYLDRYDARPSEPRKSKWPGSHGGEHLTAMKLRLGHGDPNALDVDARVCGGRMEITWAYNENVYARSTIQNLVGRFSDALRLLMTHFGGHSTGGVIPSDFPNARLSQEDLDRLISKLG
jgi:amino acid adenylation domain-containing protein/non-ribosomal peptide synthase protein (TIGR01720 family)